MLNDYIIRKMTNKDIDAVYALEVQLFPNPWPKVFFASDLCTHGTVAYVVENKEGVIGYSMANCVDRRFHVTNIAVDTRHQRRGIASRLMDLLESYARDRDCQLLYLEVRTTNIPAIRLYEHRGYAIAYRRNHYYIDGDDAYVMEKEIT